MKHFALKLGALALIMMCSACVDPYYDEPPERPVYGYYGYGPAYYPWAGGGRVDVDINNGWGHGGYYGHGWNGGGGGGHWR